MTTLQMRIWLLLAALSFGAPAAVQAQTPASAPAEPAPGTVNLDFRSTELTDVVELIARATGRNFIYGDLRGQVTVISPEPVSVEEAYRVFESILQVRGYTTVPGPGGVLKIVPTRDARESPIETLPGGAALPLRDQFVTRLVPLDHIKADAISTTLRPLASKDAHVIAYQPTNTLIITDSSANIRRLVTIIAQIDVETHREQIKVFPVEHADADTLARQLEQIFSEQAAGAATTRPAVRRRATRAAAAEGAAASVVAGLSGQARFITDERTNSIIAIATRGMIEQIQDLLPLLDYQRESGGGIHLLRLQNADAEQVAQTLSSLSTGGGASAQQGGAGAAIAQLGEGVRITADAPTNSLIVQANAEDFGTLSDVVSALDVRRPQVMVEAVIMEVDVTDGTSLGLAWLYQNELSVTNSAISIGVDPIDAISDPNGVDVIGSTAADFTTAVIGKTITLNGVDVPVIQAILTASDSNSDTNILSAPVLLTADNEEAEIIVAQEVPIPTSRLQTDAGSGFQTSQEITRQDVGVTLRVTPQISEGDTVRLEIYQEISELTGESDPELGPTTNNRQVESTVYVRDGEAVMIGGILSETQTETVTKVPFLGDIPILGWAFKATTDSVRKINLLVVLTPHIVRDPQDLQRLTVEQRERFRDSARRGLALTDDERQAREAALRAGVALPHDPNPVRRQLESHERRYPVENLPELRRGRDERERERREELERQRQAAEAGPFRVQAGYFADAEPAVQLLELLIERGYDGTLLSRSQDAATVHLVQLGPFPDMARAQHVARELRAELDLDASVVVEP